MRRRGACERDGYGHCNVHSIDPTVYYHHLVLAQEKVLLLCEAPPAKPQSLYSFSGLAQALEV